MSGTGLEIVLVNIAMAALSSFDHRHPFAKKKFRVETMTTETERYYQQQHSVDEDDDHESSTPTTPEQQQQQRPYPLYREEDCIFTRRQRRRRNHRLRSRGSESDFSEHHDEA